MTLAVEFVVGLLLGIGAEQLWHRMRDTPAGLSRPGSGRRGLARAAIAAVIVVVVGVVGGYFYANQQFDKIEKVPVGAVLQHHTGGTNYLIVGTDNRPGVQGDRSDTIIVLRVAHGKSTIMSIPRDLFVTIPGLSGEHRINTAYNDGPAVLLGAVQQTLGIPIDRYIEINFVSFAGVVDALGGVTINFPYPASDTHSGLNITQTGNVKLSGVEALAYVRSRHYTQLINGQAHVDGTADLGREQRQQGFLRAVLSKAGASKNPFKLLHIGHALADGMKVDDKMTLLDAVHFAWNMGRLNPTTVVLPTTPYTTSGGSEVLKLQTDAAAPIIAGFKA